LITAWLGIFSRIPIVAQLEVIFGRSQRQTEMFANIKRIPPRGVFGWGLAFASFMVMRRSCSALPMWYNSCGHLNHP